jgi:three-Cys-motif partner protein
MGRSPPCKHSVAEPEPFLFDAGALPVLVSPIGKDFRSLRHPVWTEEKAQLIQEYLRLFTFITKHGNYIDGFAAPQRRDLSQICSAALVLKTEPKWIRNFWLCDIDPGGVELLRNLEKDHQRAKRNIEVLEGDFNRTVTDVLASRRITTKTATFALLDQRTFECDWSTVVKLAAHKPSLGATDTKIEIFYFLATGWLDRSFAAVRRDETAQKLQRWWGDDDWRSLQGMAGIPRAVLLAKRFRDELGYAYARPYAIHNRKRNGRIMYHMIHATDHDEAAQLMLRAYRKISGRADVGLPARQAEMDELWRQATGELTGDGT